MTAYAKLCPKCQNPCDLAAPSCKRCGLKFGQPFGEAAAAAGPGPSRTGPAVGGAFLAVLVCALLVVGIIYGWGFLQKQENDRKAMETSRIEYKAHQRDFGSKD
jgi:hypothetical protein